MKKRILSALLAFVLVAASVVIALPQKAHVHAADEPESWILDPTNFGETLTQGQFSLQGYNVTTDTFVTPTFSTTGKNWKGDVVDDWQAQVPFYNANKTVNDWGAFVFAAKDGRLTSIPSCTYDANGDPIRYAAAIVFTAPADGVYEFTEAFRQDYGSGRLQTYYAAKGKQVIATTTLNGDSAGGSITGKVALKANETVKFIHKLDEAATLTVSLGAAINSLVVTKVAGEGIIEGVNKWTLPMDWSNLGEKDETGWIRPKDGNWELRSYSHLGKNKEIFVLGKEGGSAGVDADTPAPYLANSVNEALAGRAGAYTSWYLNSNKRWSEGDPCLMNPATYLGEPVIQVSPRNTQAGIVFTAPEDGTYTYNESLACAIYDISGYKQAVTVTVRVNGLIIDSFTSSTTEATFPNLTGSICLKAGDELVFGFENALNAFSGNYGVSNGYCFVKEISVTKTDDYIENFSMNTVVPVFDGTSLTDTTGNFKLQGYKLAEKEFFDLTMVVDGTTWKAQWDNAVDQNYKNVFTGTVNGSVSSFGADYKDRNVTPAFVYTVPKDGEYIIYGTFTQTYCISGGENKTSLAAYTEILKNGEVIVTSNTYDDNGAANGNIQDDLGIRTYLKAGDKIMFIRRVHEANTWFTTFGAKDVSISVTQITHMHKGGEATCINKADCVECGEEYGAVDASNHDETCIPTYTKTETSHSVNWSECNLSQNSVDHTWENGACGECEYACLHPSNSFAGSCTELAICAICGQSHGAVDPDSHWGDIEFDYLNVDEKYHYIKFDCCNGEFKPEAHVFIDGMCAICEFEFDAEDHTCVGGNATCIKKAVCELCGREYGEFSKVNHAGDAKWIKETNFHAKKYTCCNATALEREAHDLDANNDCTECGFHWGDYSAEGLAMDNTKVGFFYIAGYNFTTKTIADVETRPRVTWHDDYPGNWIVGYENSGTLMNVTQKTETDRSDVAFDMYPTADDSYASAVVFNNTEDGVFNVTIKAIKVNTQQTRVRLMKNDGTIIQEHVLTNSDTELTITAEDVELNAGDQLMLVVLKGAEQTTGGSNNVGFISYEVVNTADGPTDVPPEVIENYAEITKQPESVLVSDGKPITIMVEATGDELTYAWYYKNKGTSTFAYTATFKGNVYSTTMNATRDGRQVYCVITDKYGNSVTTKIVTMTMDNKSTVKLDGVSANVSGSLNANATITVNATGDGLTYKWYYKSKGMTTFAHTTSIVGKTYSVALTEARNGRQVYCVVTDKYGNKVQTETYTLTLVNPVKITKVTAVTSAKINETISVTVNATGEGLTYKWYYKNKGVSGFTYTASFKGNTYSTTMSDARNGRQIYCVVTDKHGNTVKTETYTFVKIVPVKITSVTKNNVAANGGTVSVTVNATGEGLTYKWYFRNKGISTYTLTTTFKGNTYSTTMDSTRDGRQIYCVVTDKYGNTVKSEVVTLNKK